jgi:uncharacterized protein
MTDETRRVVAELMTRIAVADHFRALTDGHVATLNRTSVDRILVDGPHAVVLGRIVQTTRRTRVGYTSPFALHLTVDGGLVTRYHIYEDSLTVTRALSATTAHS